MQTRIFALHPAVPLWRRRGVWRPRRAILRVRATQEPGQKARPNRQGEATEDFTPFTMIDYDLKPENFCKHCAEIEVNVTPEVCFNIWNEWKKLIDFLDLIGQIFTDPENRDAAALLCYYRYGQFPILQILTFVEKSEINENESIGFESTAGMALRGKVEFIPLENGRTNVRLRFEHVIPACLLWMKIGVYSVENHMQTILEENMATFKMLAEGDLEFDDHSNDRESILEKFNEMKALFENSASVTEDEPYQPSDIDEYGGPASEFEVFPDGMDNF